MLPTYPDNDLDRPYKLLGFLGSFWTEVFTGRALTAQLLSARAQLDKQTQLDFTGLLAAMSRFTVRVSRPRYWYQVSLLQSKMQIAGLATYGGPYFYQTPPQIQYGVLPTWSTAA
jgi:hypothetical protein